MLRNQGKFANDFRFKVLRTEKNGENLIFNSYEAEVVSQLRYEYALNLIQKLGVFPDAGRTGFFRWKIKIMKKSKKTRFLAIDLCCGCGGLSLGLKRGGIRHSGSG